MIGTLLSQMRIIKNGFMLRKESGEPCSSMTSPTNSRGEEAVCSKNSFFALQSHALGKEMTHWFKPVRRSEKCFPEKCSR